MITVGIKVLDQASSIADAIDSAAEAVLPLGGAVVVADSGSTDGTVEIARSRGVCVVQLANIAERTCGAAAQLAWQHSDTPYFFMMDGDMIAKPEFLKSAYQYMESNPDVAACGGAVIERTLVNDEYRIRNAAMQHDPNRKAGDVTHLDGGGLYRQKAVQDSGYFSDQNLHACEEFELGARLRERGWRLLRLPIVSAEHSGYALTTYRLLIKKARSGYLDAPGEVLRSAIARGRLLAVLLAFRPIRGIAGVYAYWIVIAGSLALMPSISEALLFAVALTLLGLSGLAYRRRSFARGVYSFTSWNLQALASARGFLRPRRPPKALESVVLQPGRHARAQ